MAAAAEFTVFSLSASRRVEIVVVVNYTVVKSRFFFCNSLEDTPWNPPHPHVSSQMRHIGVSLRLRRCPCQFGVLPTAEGRGRGGTINNNRPRASKQRRTLQRSVAAAICFCQSTHLIYARWAPSRFVRRRCVGGRSCAQFHPELQFHFSVSDVRCSATPSIS